MKRALVVGIGILGLSLAVAACNGGKETGGGGGVGQPVVNFPEWVMKGSGAFNEGGSRSFYGVGSVSGMKNQALAMTTAGNRARAEIAKTFEVYSASLMKDYMASTTAGDMSASSEEQHVEAAIKTFSAVTLAGVVISDRWIHPDGTVYALAKLDIEAMKEMADKSQELDAKVRDYVRENAQKSFDALDAEESKRAP